MWTLSFDKQNQSEMIENKDNDCVIDIFIRHSKSEDHEVKRTCTKALWTMKDGLRSSQYYQQIGEFLLLLLVMVFFFIFINNVKNLVLTIILV